MAKQTSKRQVLDDDRQPVALGDRAMDNIAFIRETMERSTAFTAVPGYGGILMGATACVAAYIAATRASLADSLGVWLIEAFLAFSIGLLAMWQKSKIAGQPLISAPAKKFALGFAPPLAAGVIAVLGLWRFGHFYEMAPVSMLTYGAAVASGGSFSVKIIPAMGWLFIAFGAATFLLPTGYANLLMALSFGGLHIIFGAIIARNYGG